MLPLQTRLTKNKRWQVIGSPFFSELDVALDNDPCRNTSNTDEYRGGGIAEHMAGGISYNI